MNKKSEIYIYIYGGMNNNNKPNRAEYRAMLTPAA